jgi:hypothetical protein
LVIASSLRPHAARSALEDGLFYSFSRFDQMLPLLGLGLALIEAPRMAAFVSLLTLAAGIPVGGLVAALLAGAVSNPLLSLGYVLTIAPAASIATGLALIGRGRWRAWMLPIAALLCGGSLGLVINMSGGTSQEWRFAVGAILGGGAILAAPMLLLGGLRVAWLEIPVRIFGSWLIALGAMLGASVLIRF